MSGGFIIIISTLHFSLYLFSILIKGIFEFLLKWQPIFTIIFGYLTIRMVFKNYEFNYKKNSFSTISIKGGKEDSEIMTPTLKSKKHNLIRSYINSTNDNDIYFKEVESELGSTRLELKYHPEYGFPNFDQHHNSYDWYLEIKNIGDFPSTDINIQYEIRVEKLLWETVVHEDSSTSSHEFSLIENDRISREIVIPYMAADEEKKVFVCSLRGEFPKALLFVNTMYSNELTFISETTLVDTYEHPTLQDVGPYNSSGLFSLAGNITLGVENMNKSSTTKENEERQPNFEIKEPEEE